MKKTENNEEIKKIKINPPKKINFFVRLKNAIFKLENYGEFVLEKTRTSISYFFKLLLIVTIVLAAISTYNFNTIVTKAFAYIQNELPEFNYADGKIAFNEDKEGYDKDLDFYVIINTKSEMSEGAKEGLKEKVKDYSMAMIMLQDKLILTEYGQAIEYTYNSLEANYGIDTLNKTDLIGMIESVGINGINITYFLISIVSLYVANVITISLDVVLVYLFGLIISKLCGVNMPSLKVLSLAIYSLTLSIVLSTIYSVVYNLTGFVIEYFDIMYLMVAYVYLVAAILIIKSDVIKQRMELQKIIEVEKQVKKELEEQKENKENESKDKKDEKENKDEKGEKEEEPILNREPDGSEI